MTQQSLRAPRAGSGSWCRPSRLVASAPATGRGHQDEDDARRDDGRKRANTGKPARTATPSTPRATSSGAIAAYQKAVEIDPKQRPGPLLPRRGAARRRQPDRGRGGVESRLARGERQGGPAAGARPLRSRRPQGAPEKVGRGAGPPGRCTSTGRPGSPTPAPSPAAPCRGSRSSTRCRSRTRPTPSSASASPTPRPAASSPTSRSRRPR